MNRRADFLLVDDPSVMILIEEFVSARPFPNRLPALSHSSHK